MSHALPRSFSAAAARSGGRDRLRVAFLSFDFPEYCIAIANALAATDDVLLLLPGRYLPRVASYVDPAVRLEAFDKPRLRQVGRQVRVSANLARRVRRFEPDVVHVQQGHFWWNLAQPLVRRYPLVVTVHNVVHHPGDSGGRKTPLWLYEAGFRQADHLIVHGAALETQLRTRSSLARKTVSVVPHVVIGNEEQPAQEIAEEDGTILFFGRLWPYKGLEYLIRAEPLIAAQVPGARIVIAGRGERFDRYRRLMTDPARYEVHNRFVSNQERTELFSRASVVVLPYIEASQSGVVHVAYALGKPVVATTVGALPEAVDDGRTGLLVPPRDERALASAIVRLLHDPDLRRSFGEAGRRKVETECAPEAVAALTRSVYAKAIVARQGVGSRRSAT